MRNPDRINDILVELGVYWSRNPDLRLGQIIGNMASPVTDPYHYEDSLLLDALTVANKLEDN